MNIGVSQQAKALQAFQAANDGGEAGNSGGIEDVTALDGGGHIQVVLDQEMHFVFFFGVEIQAVGGGFEGAINLGLMYFPTGGTTGQILTKTSATDFATAW